MPTDPFVSPDPDDKPRQQQNLPPGVAYPPAKAWVPTRPGDHPVGYPSGPLHGAPGPNIGWAYTLATRAKDRFKLDKHEHVEDAVPVVAEIGARRAASYGRAPVIRDIEFAASLLGYDSNNDAFATTRARLVHDAGHSYNRRRAIVDSVPDDLLRAPVNEVRARASQWRAEVPGLVEAEAEL